MVDWLQKMVFMSRVEIADVTDDYADRLAARTGFGQRAATRSGLVGGHEVFLPRAELAGSRGRRPGSGVRGASGRAATRGSASTPTSAPSRTSGWLGVGVHLNRRPSRSVAVARVHNLGRSAAAPWPAASGRLGRPPAAQLGTWDARRSRSGSRARRPGITSGPHRTDGETATWTRDRLSRRLWPRSQPIRDPATQEILVHPEAGTARACRS